MDSQITHEGVVVKCDGRDVLVRIVQHSACSGCHAKFACTASDSAEKFITADGEGLQYAVGEEVTVCVRRSAAWQAVVLAFVCPIVLGLAGLFVATQWVGEAQACLIALALLACYYLAFYLLRDRLLSGYTFTVERM